jgi:hypothetical protein
MAINVVFENEKSGFAFWLLDPNEWFTCTDFPDVVFLKVNNDTEDNAVGFEEGSTEGDTYTFDSGDEIFSCPNITISVGGAE